MQYRYALLLPALAAGVAAQSPPTFPIQVKANLRVDFLNSSTSVSPAGVLLPRDDVLYAPTVYGPEDATEDATYILFMVDQDVNINDTRVELLHYFQPNLVGASHELSVQASAQNATTAVGAEYLTPTPPGGDGPHRYTFLLYPQPANFAVPEAFASFSPPADVNARYPFNMSGFAAAAGLGEPIAANWLRVVNDTSDATGSSSSSSSSTASGTASGTASATASGTAASTGAGASGSSSPTAAASAAATSTNSAAGIVEVRGNMRELVVGLVMGVAGAWMWML